MSELPPKIGRRKTRAPQRGKPTQQPTLPTRAWGTQLRIQGIAEKNTWRYDACNSDPGSASVPSSRLTMAGIVQVDLNRSLAAGKIRRFLKTSAQLVDGGDEHGKV